MKTPSTVKVLILCMVYVALIFVSCKHSPESTDSSDSTNQSDTAATPTKSVLEFNPSNSRLLGASIDSTAAGIITRNYYEAIPASMKDLAAKSVYFETNEILNFIDQIRNANLCTGTLGFRVYFAKYPNNPSYPYPGQQTVILRATCDGRDLPHQVTAAGETVKVAYNYGDVCPPRCNIASPGQVYTSGGEYRTRGNCNGCPQQ